MNEIEENFAYLKDVLGVKYLPLESQEKLSLEISEPTLESVASFLQGCERCPLSRDRKTIVFGSGPQGASLMFIGEGPGEQEDLQGLPFVGPAGQLLTKMVEAMGFTRQTVYIANVVKCRPPLNRKPEPDEISACSPFLLQQIELVNPEIIVALGATAAQSLLHTEEKISKLRGRVHSFQGRKLIATFHPSYLLRNPAEKKSAWADLQFVTKELDNKTLV